MKKQPNILLFVPDGMQAGVLTDEACLTPNFQRAMRRGVHFNRAYTPSQLCSPARASLMTGMLPHNHGVLQVEHCVDDDQSVLRSGYAHWAQRLVGKATAPAISASGISSAAANSNSTAGSRTGPKQKR